MEFICLYHNKSKSQPKIIWTNLNTIMSARPFTKFFTATLFWRISNLKVFTIDGQVANLVNGLEALE